MEGLGDTLPPGEDLALASRSSEMFGRKSCAAFALDSAVKPHEASLGWGNEGVRIIRTQIKDMNNRAANMLLPREYDEAISNGDHLVVHGVSKACIFTREDLHR